MINQKLNVIIIENKTNKKEVKYRGGAHGICNLRYKVSKEIPVVFYNGSTYAYHFIIKQLQKKFKGNFDCLGENTEKYITFSVPIKKELKNGKVIIYKLKFIDSYRFMSTSLSNLIDNSTEINNVSEINKKISLIELGEKFPSTYKFYNKDLNKFELLLRKGIYPYEHMDSWERFNETSLPDK